MSKPVTITFLGGLSDIGRNCAAIEAEGKILVLDCGVLFPNEDQPGVESILPDLEYLYQRADSVIGCLLTHAHEDHVGALKHLLGKVPCKVYGSAFSLGVANRRLRESDISADFVEIAAGETVKIGPFSCEFLSVTHSIPGGHISAITTPQGIILHSSDFKLDQSPVRGGLTDLSRIGELARNPGIRLLLADSTNSDLPGVSNSESSVGPVLKETFLRHEGRRLVVACFSSHLHRIQQVVDAAYEAGRRIAIMGRSMQENIDLGRDLDILDMDDYEDFYNAHQIPDAELCVICTGSQAEPNSFLTKVSQGKNRWMDVTENDTIILSANPIPGNEARIYQMVNNLMRRGAIVEMGANIGLHTTGHGRQYELSVLHSAASPEWFVPVHGEFRHLTAHAELAENLGMDPGRVLLALDGDQVELTSKGLNLKQNAAKGSYLLYQGSLVQTDSEFLKERLSLAKDGVLILVATVINGELAEPVFVDSRGWIGSEGAESKKMHSILVEKLSQAAEEALESGINSEDLLKVLKKVAREKSKDLTSRFPAIMAHIAGQ